MTVNMTEGKPLRLLLRFALPMMFSAMLQQMYTLCDSFLVGRLLGTDAFTAATSASNLNWFPLHMLLGAVTGFGITLSHSFGSGNREEFRRFFAGILVLGLLLGSIFSIGGLLLAEELFQLLHTPEQLLAQAIQYVRVLWMGFAVTALLNIFTTALLAVGDSRTPLVALAVSSVINIVLDVALIGWLRMGIAGAALATVLAQAVTALWSWLGLRRVTGILPTLPDFRPRKRIYRELIRLGFPQLLCSGVTTSGELLVQAAVNTWGVAFVTGMTASRKYLNLLNVINYGLEGALATYVGQNWGAGKYSRIEDGTRSCIRMGLLTAVGMGLGVFLLAEPMIRFLVPDAAPEAIRFGREALQVQAVFLPSLYLLCEYRAAIRGMGNALIPMLSGFLELAMRIGCTLLLPLFLNSKGLYFTDAAAWVPTMALLWATYLFMQRKYLRAP